MPIYFEGNPSEITDEYWVHARRKKGTYPPYTNELSSSQMPLSPKLNKGLAL